MSPIDKIPSGSIPVDSLSNLKSQKTTESRPPQGARPFSELLNERISPNLESAVSKDLKFSAHAQTRLKSRGIDLSPDEMMKLKEAVEKVGLKGSRESLILTDKAAFVVSVKNSTVITAVDRESLKENVFTNIDSTVMI
jgi:flagellar operon protein